jgi:5-methylcytosine-specific restriction protein A
MSSAFHSSAKWQRARARYLRKHPVCETCLKDGKVEVAVEVDHIDRIVDGGDPLDPSNLQAICRAHHVAKTTAENAGRDWRKWEVRGCDATGRPLDPNHAWNQEQANGADH